jgi:hypothetical protein
VTTERPNPYVGPRPFDEEDAPLFFGREAEVHELVSRVVANRVVLFYAASGAGKTSLLNAGATPSLRDEERFEVLPRARLRRVTEDEIRRSTRQTCTPSPRCSTGPSTGPPGGGRPGIVSPGS